MAFSLTAAEAALFLCTAAARPIGGSVRPGNEPLKERRDAPDAVLLADVVANKPTGRIQNRASGMISSYMSEVFLFIDEASGCLSTRLDRAAASAAFTTTPVRRARERSVRRKPRRSS